MLKPIDPDATIGVISIFDPSIDNRGDENFDKFYGSKDGGGVHSKSPEKWRDYITAKSGETITEYKVGTIPSYKMNEIEDKHRPGSSQHFWECFIWGLRDIVDGPTMETTDASGKKKFTVPKLPDGRVDPEWLGNIFSRGNRKVALSVGMYAFSWQRFSVDDARP